MFDGIETNAFDVELFSKPYSPILDIIFDFRVIVVEVGIHEVVVVAFFFIYRLRPVLPIPLDPVDGCLVVRCIVVRTGEMIPIRDKRSYMAQLNPTRLANDISDCCICLPWLGR